MTMDGKINADMVLTGILHAVEILMGEQSVEYPDGSKHYPVEIYPNGDAHFSGEIRCGDIDETTKTNKAYIGKDGKAIFSDLSVSNGTIIGAQYESMKDVPEDTSKSTRMELNSAHLEFYRGDYQAPDADHDEYWNDEKQAELTTNTNGVALNAVNNNRASVGSEGVDVFYTENSEGYFGAAIHGNKNALDDMKSVTADTFVGDLEGTADEAKALTTDAGDSTTPVYISNGKPHECSLDNMSVGHAGNAGQLYDGNIYATIGTENDMCYIEVDGHRFLWGDGGGTKVEW